MPSEIVKGPEEGSSAVSFTIKEEENLKKFKVGMSQTLPFEIAASDKLKVRFMARSPQMVTIGVVMDTIRPPFRNKIYHDFILTSEWQTYEIVADKDVAFASGEGSLRFFLSFTPGQVEITKVELMKTASSK
jgi:hypothetical protein